MGEGEEGGHEEGMQGSTFLGHSWAKRVDVCGAISRWDATDGLSRVARDGEGTRLGRNEHLVCSEVTFERS